MKESRFRGWKDVFSFTFHQMTKKSGYRGITAIVGLLLIFGLALVVVITGEPEESKVESCGIETVYAVDEYKVDYAQMLAVLGKSSYLGVKFVNVPDSETAMENAKQAGESAVAIVEVSYRDGAFYMEGILPKNSTATQSDTETGA